MGLDYYHTVVFKRKIASPIISSGNNINMIINQFMLSLLSQSSPAFYNLEEVLQCLKKYKRHNLDYVEKASFFHIMVAIMSFSVSNMAALD